MTGIHNDTTLYPKSQFSKSIEDLQMVPYSKNQ